MLFIFFVLCPIAIVAWIIVIGNQKLATLPDIPKLPPRAELPKEQKASEMPNFPNTFEVTIKDNHYLVAFEKILDSRNLTLIPNFQEKKTSKELVATNTCTHAINGGFYTKTGLPLGLFVTQGKILAPQHVSNLTNGFFWIDSKANAHIDSNPPSEITNIPFILQSGPLLKMADFPQTKLAITNDKPARRMFLGIDTKGSVFFFSVFEKENLLSGPYLANLSDIVSLLEEKLAVVFVNAINLDGGTASTFWSKDVSLQEVAVIGSLLCEK